MSALLTARGRRRSTPTRLLLQASPPMESSARRGPRKPADASPPSMVSMAAWRNEKSQRAVFYRGRHSASAWGNLASVHHVLGNLTQLDVQVLRRAPQHCEGLVGGDPLALDENALGLADDLP